jgi:biotin-dependent carboxylase-like uncharacterized protein
MQTPSYYLFKVISPGLFTTVQDRGRYGYQRFGVPVNGVMDPFAAAMANHLVGNGDDAAVLECTMAGPSFAVLDHASVAVTGANMPIFLNGQAVAGWSSFRVRAGDVLEIGQAQSGCRGYIAVTGGFEVPLVMGSRSCYVGAGIGGLQGRPLQQGDRLHRGIGRILPESRRIPAKLVPQYHDRITLRAIPGPQDDYFDEGLEMFFSTEFTVSHEANRAGYRLTGPAIRQKPGRPVSIISESSLPGGVQIPPNGQPIILLAEQTVGGYTKIATVISSDLWLVGQAMPGNTIRFQRIDLDTAHALKRNEKAIIERMKAIIELTDSVRDLQRCCAAGHDDDFARKFADLYPECSR